MKSLVPVRKVTAATAGAALGELIGWLLVTVFGVATFPTTALTIILTFALGWLIPEKK